MEREEKIKEKTLDRYSLDKSPMGIIGVGFGIPAARTILDETVDHVFYTSIDDKVSFDKATELALRSIV